MKKRRLENLRRIAEWILRQWSADVTKREDAPVCLITKDRADARYNLYVVDEYDENEVLVAITTAAYNYICDRRTRTSETETAAQQNTPDAFSPPPTTEDIQSSTTPPPSPPSNNGAT